MGGPVVVVGPGHRVDGVGGDVAARDDFLHPDVADGVTGPGAAARGLLHSGGGAHLVVHSGLVGVPGAREDLAVAVHQQVDDVDPVGLEVLTLVVDDDFDRVAVVVDGDLRRRRARCGQGVVAVGAADFIPAFRGAGNPEDTRAVRGHGQVHTCHREIVGDGHTGAIGHLRPGDHDAPLNFLIGTGKPAGLVDFGGHIRLVANAALPVREGNIHSHAVAQAKGEFVGLGQCPHLRLDPQRAADVVLVLDVLIQGADHLGLRHLAGAVGERVALLPLQVEAALRAYELLGQSKHEGVSGSPGAVRDAPRGVDPDRAPHVDGSLVRIHFLKMDTGRLNAVHLGRLCHRGAGYETSQNNQQCDEERHRPTPPRKPDHFQHFPSFVTALYVAIYFPDDSRF